MELHETRTAQAASSEMSHLAEMATDAGSSRPSIPAMSLRVSSQPDLEKQTTFAPCSTNRIAMAWPKPRLAPLTRHTWTVCVRKRGRRRGRVRGGCLVGCTRYNVMWCGWMGWLRTQSKACCNCCRARKRISPCQRDAAPWTCVQQGRIPKSEGKEGKKERMSKTWAVTHTQRHDTAHRKAQHGVM